MKGKGGLLNVPFDISMRGKIEEKKIKKEKKGYTYIKKEGGEYFSKVTPPLPSSKFNISSLTPLPSSKFNVTSLTASKQLIGNIYIKIIFIILRIIFFQAFVLFLFNSS